MTSPILFDKLVDFSDDVGGGLVIKHTQEIPDEHLAALRLERTDSLSTPAGEFHRVASIPTNVVEQWAREGFDVHQESVQDILKRLRQHQLDTFITTNRRI